VLVASVGQLLEADVVRVLGLQLSVSTKIVEAAEVAAGQEVGEVAG
jgi:hypothetical protein